MTTRRQASQQVSEDLHDDLADDPDTPVKVWLGPAELDPIDTAGDEDQCGLETFAVATRDLITGLINGSLSVGSDSDVRLLAMVDESWSHYVDPALSESPTQARQYWRLVLWECPEHVLEIRGSRRRWRLFRFGEEIEPDEIFPTADLANEELDPFIPDDHGDDLMSTAERDHLLGRIARAEEKARVAKETVRREAATAEKRLQQVIEAATVQIELLEREATRAKARAEKATAEARARTEQLIAEAARLREVAEEAGRLSQLEQQQLLRTSEERQAELRASLREAKAQTETVEDELNDSRKLTFRVRQELERTQLRLTESEAAVQALGTREAELEEVLERATAREADLREELRNARTQRNADQQTIRERGQQVDKLQQQLDLSRQEAAGATDENRRIRLAIEMNLSGRQRRRLDPHL